MPGDVARRRKGRMKRDIKLGLVVGSDGCKYRRHGWRSATVTKLGRCSNPLDGHRGTVHVKGKTTSIEIATCVATFKDAWKRATSSGSSGRDATTTRTALASRFNSDLPSFIKILSSSLWSSRSESNSTSRRVFTPFLCKSAIGYHSENRTRCFVNLRTRKFHRDSLARDEGWIEN